MLESVGRKEEQLASLSEYRAAGNPCCASEENARRRLHYLLQDKRDRMIS